VTGFAIGGHHLGANDPTYFIADVAANHDGSLSRAIELIHLSAEAGANAAKFQNFAASTIVSDFGFRALGSQKSHQAGWQKSVFEVYQDASIPLEWAPELKRACDEARIDYFTAPYDIGMIPYLSRYVCAWKVGSGDVTWHQSIEAMARDGKPVLIATGAATMAEVEGAMDVAVRHTQDVVLMQCNTNYTGSLENYRHVALNVLKSYARRWPNVILGLSDHTPGHSTVLGSVALGARAIEKHFTDDTKRTGPDHGFSMDPASWREMVDRTRELELALGPTEKRIMDNEAETVVLQRRAVRARRTLKAGHVLAEADLIPLRPCPTDAVPPYRQGELVGRTLRRDMTEGDCVRPGDLR
jgi:sialic acid synthase SpsE